MAKKKLRAEETRKRMLKAIRAPKVPAPIPRTPTQEEVLRGFHRGIDVAADTGLRHYRIDLYGRSQEEIDVIQKVLPKLQQEGYEVTEYDGPVSDSGDHYGPDYTVRW